MDSDLERISPIMNGFYIKNHPQISTFEHFPSSLVVRIVKATSSLIRLLFNQSLFSREQPFWRKVQKPKDSLPKEIPIFLSSACFKYVSLNIIPFIIQTLMIHSKEIQSQIKVFKQIFLRSVLYKFDLLQLPQEVISGR